MALNQKIRYPVGTAIGDANYPVGSAVNSTAPGALNGYPWEKDQINDLFGYFQGLLSRAGITASGNPDTVLVSDYLDALSVLTGFRSGVTHPTIAAMVGDLSIKTAGVIIRTQNNNVASTGGGSEYVSKTVSEAAADGDDVDDEGSHALDSGLVAIITSGTGIYDLLQFGGFNDGVTINDAALIAIRKLTSNPHIASGTYKFSNGVDLAGIWGEGLISNDTETIPVRNFDDFLPIKSHSLLNPVIYDMHYGALKGVPFNGVSGIVLYTIGAADVKGSFSITVTGSKPSSGDLLAYKATDGLWYTTVVDVLPGGDIVDLKSALEADIDTNGILSNFYNNVSHPNDNGYNAIADYMIRGKLKSFQRVAKIFPSSFSGGLIVFNNSINPFNPGGTNVDALNVTPVGASSGCRFEWIPKETGFHIVRLKLNTANLDVTIRVSYPGGLAVSTTYNDSTASFVDVPIFVPGDLGGTILIDIFRDSTTFILSEISILKPTGTSLQDLNQGKHVFLGDSWFAITPGIIERMQERLPNAVLVNKGVGGNKAQDLVGRFDTDVTPEDPDYVWMSAGTNDYFAGVSVADFSFYINQLKQQALEIGAIPILMTSSVGETAVPANYNRSREYLDQSNYFDYVEYLGPERILVPISTHVPAGDTVAVATLGRYDGEIIIYESYIVGVALNVDEGGGLPASTNIGSISSGYDGSVRTLSVTPVRWVQLNYTAVGAVNVQGYVIISKPENVNY